MKPVTTDTWQVTYTDCIGATEAPADGSVGKWKEEGYFVAHCHMAGGKEILAQHEYVIVDGKRYKLVSTKIIGRKSGTMPMPIKVLFFRPVMVITKIFLFTINLADFSTF